jgi:hypothetical protein
MRYQHDFFEKFPGELDWLATSLNPHSREYVRIVRSGEHWTHAAFLSGLNSRKHALDDTPPLAWPAIDKMLFQLGCRVSA